MVLVLAFLLLVPNSLDPYRATMSSKAITIILVAATRTLATRPGPLGRQLGEAGGESTAGLIPASSALRRNRSNDVRDVHPEAGQRSHEPGVTESEDSAVCTDEPVPLCVGGVDDSDYGKRRDDAKAGQ